MSFIDEMRNLRNSIEVTREKTARAVKEIKRDTRGLRIGAQKLVDGFRTTQKANAQQIREDLRHATQNLVRNVKRMRGNNIRSQQELKRDLASAQNIFWGKQKKQEKEE